MIQLDNSFSPLQRELVNELRKHDGPMTRMELVKAVKKPRTTVYDNLMRLVTQGYIMKKPHYRNTLGRPKVYYYLIEDEFK
jgi:predicted ArsR family transcriptional regulator